MRKLFQPKFSVITTIFIIVFLITETVSYISNSGAYFLLYTSIFWGFSYIAGITFLKMLEYLSLLANVRILRFGIILFLSLPTLYIADNIYEQVYKDSSFTIAVLLFANLSLFLSITGVLCLHFFSKEYREGLAKLVEGKHEPVVTDKGQTLLEPVQLLGQGSSTIDRVIKSTFYRANRSDKTARLSLVLIVILVFIGGRISVGTIALNQFSKLRQLEKVRQNMLIAHNQFEVNSFKVKLFEGTIKGSEEAKLLLRQDSILLGTINHIIKSTYGNEDDIKNFKEMLANIQKKESYNISEIIMRVAIAAMTFFLVQVFLRIYKFHQQQSTSLLTKAEVLELFNDHGSDINKLREILASKIEENPKFGNTPSTPIEQIINIADKTKGNGVTH